MTTISCASSVLATTAGCSLSKTDPLASETVSDIVHTISKHIDHEQADGVLYVSANWL
jgi:hypothetical protein